MNYIILDLEATCWEDRNNRKQNEIIEIGAVKVNESGNVVSEFNEFIKPKLNPVLSDFCKELTSITQEEINGANLFTDVIEKFKEWIDMNESFILCSWGFYDITQLIKDCELHDVDRAWLENHISLKHQFAEIKGLKRPIGMKGALNIEKIKLEGTHHRGIDDARNITKIFLSNLEQWKIH
jgi:inhibitor of KinA sporulation pathway (predicted exonuclease)